MAQKLDLSKFQVEEPPQLDLSKFKFDLSKFDMGPKKPPATFGSRSYDMFEGLLGFGKNALTSGARYFMGDNNAAADFGRGILQGPTEQFTKHAEQGDYLKGAIRAAGTLAGLNPDAIDQDYNEGNYGALFGDLGPPLIAGLAMSGLHGKGKGIRSAELPEVLPKENISGRLLTGKVGSDVLPDIEVYPGARQIAGTAPERLRLPAIGETSITGDPRFYQGARGIADVQNTIPYDLADPAKLRGNPLEGLGLDEAGNPMLTRGTLLPSELGEIGQVPPMMAAEGTLPGLRNQSWERATVSNAPNTGESFFKPSRTDELIQGEEVPNDFTSMFGNRPNIVTRLSQPIGGRVVDAPTKAVTPNNYLDELGLEHLRVTQPGVYQYALETGQKPLPPAGMSIEQVKAEILSKGGKLPQEPVRDLGVPFNKGTLTSAEAPPFRAELTQQEMMNRPKIQRPFPTQYGPNAQVESPLANAIPLHGPNGTITAATDLPHAPGVTPIGRLQEAMRKAIPLNKEQLKINAQERAKRIAKVESMPGETQADYNARKAALSGEYEKVAMEPMKLEAADVDSLFKQIQSHPDMIGFNKFHAGEGLGKILLGKVPQRAEIASLEKVFGKAFANDVISHLPVINKAGRALTDAANVPRSIMASMDMSAPLRQGFGLIHKTEFWKALPTMVKSFGSEATFKAAQEAIEAHPRFKFAQDSGLSLTTLGDIGSREEAFASRLADKIPGVRPSERAYVGFLNKLRFDTFNSLTKDMAIAGEDVAANGPLAKEMAGFVNNATGRGSLGALEKHAAALNAAFFSPRLISSRLQMLYPGTYIKASWPVRMQYIQSAAAMIGAGATVLTALKLAGAKVGTDPGTTDFGKAQIGNTRIDPWAGHQQFVSAFMRMGKGLADIYYQDKPPGYGQRNPLDVAVTFAQTKANPVAGFAMDMIRGKDLIGNPASLPGEVKKLFTPLITQDLWDLFKEDPTMLLVGGIPAFFGMGAQVYKNKDNNPFAK